MIDVVNYLLEANLVLLIMLAFYTLCLRKETQFTVMRGFLLLSIVGALIFPLVKISLTSDATGLSIGEVMPGYWLPELSVSAGDTSGGSSWGAWRFITIFYLTGLGVSLFIALRQLYLLIRVIQRSRTHKIGKLRIAESDERMPTFSFFNFIMIDRKDLTSEEIDQIIRHESAHASQWHSLDILLVNFLKIVFWFNPFINTYKKIFIQLHEFEADARAVKISDVNKYCSLLAKVALQSADLRLANYFNNSLTVKRIEMIRTLKRSITRWKFAAAAISLPAVFLFVACQDQVTEDMRNIARNSSHVLDAPQFVMARFDEVQTANPGKKYVLLELNETASRQLDDLQKQFGLPSSIEIFKTVNGRPVGESVIGKADQVVLQESNQKSQKKDEQTFAIVEFNQEATRISETVGQQDKVFTVVEEQPQVPGGYEALLEFVRGNLRYPESARQQGIEGTVYASLIVEPDGSMSDIKVVRGLSPECDQEVVRIVKMLPTWIPGKQGGQPVRVRFAIPIKFELGLK
jgi:TonB family protein